MPTVKELKTLLHAKGMPVSGNKPELIARLKKKTVVATTSVPKTTRLSRNKSNSVPKNVYEKMQGRKTHDGSCLYINQQMPGKVYQKVFDKKNKTFKYKEYNRKVQKGGYRVSNSRECSNYTNVDAYVFPYIRGDEKTPYVIENTNDTLLDKNDYNKPIEVINKYGIRKYACWDTNKRGWVRAVHPEIKSLGDDCTFDKNGYDNCASGYVCDQQTFKCTTPGMASLSSGTQW